MTGLLLNEQSWLALLYFVVLPLLAIGIAIATFQRKDSRARRTAPVDPTSEPAPVDPTPMASEPLPKSDRPVVTGDRILAISTPATVPPPAAYSDSEASARLATAQSHLQAAKSRLEAQDRELDTLRTELDTARMELGERQRAIERLTRQTEEQSARIDALAERGAELDTLRKELEEIRSNRVAAVAPPAAVFEDSLDILDTDDDEIVVPMPASAVDEFELDEPEEEPQPEPGRLHHNLGPTDDRLLTPTVLDLLSMDFDGTTTPTVVESAFTGLSGGGFTIEAWIRPAQTRLPRTVLSYSVAGSSRFVLSGGGPRPSLGVELDGHTLPDDLQPRLIADVWQHVGVSWDSSGGRLTVYLDGALAFSGEIAPSARIPGGGRLLLGQQSSRGAQVPIPGRAYEGGLAEVRVWSHVRSPTEIQRDTHRRVVLQDGLDVWRVG